MDGPILAIESSCDETAVAILGTNGDILANKISSQDEVHGQYGVWSPRSPRENILQRLLV